MTTKTKKSPHAADQVDTAAIAGATDFTATILRDGKQDQVTARTLAQARSNCRELEKQAGNGRKALVHAIVKGRAILVPHDFGRGVAPKAKAAPAKKGSPKTKARVTRDGSKTEKVIAMLRNGATRLAIIEATGWQVDLKQLAARKGLRLKKDKAGVIRATGGL
jgi:hypothetical protein